MITYYVSSEIGSNNNAGTSTTAPLATLLAAADRVRPGDAVPGPRVRPPLGRVRRSNLPPPIQRRSPSQPPPAH